MEEHQRFCLFGAAPDTSNLGVSALCRSITDNLSTRGVSELTVFDNGNGERYEDVYSHSTRIRRHHFGPIHTRRFYRPANLLNMRVCGRLNVDLNPGIRAIRNAAAVLDISGGDSFSEIYGARRFDQVIQMKQLAIQQRVPLVLMPQTYGPFNTHDGFETARQIVRHAAMAWARDPQSFDVLRELLGNKFDSNRHRLGVDVAFGLDTVPMDLSGDPRLQKALLAPRRRPCVGINVSGMLYNQDQIAQSRFGLRANYREVVNSICDRLLETSEATLLFVPHVNAPNGAIESDVDACREVYERLRVQWPDRVLLAPSTNDPRQAKWLIGHTDWFCGGRMHATIAALSSGVPATVLAYSPKARGVFETCGLGPLAIDLRRETSQSVVARLLRGWMERSAHWASLVRVMPRVHAKLDDQFDVLLNATVKNKNVEECAA
ncbi:MAG: polysaccharide pyruvyl transferase family protein [Planctomycetota bacterium]|jgi:polysaccharide pyruvyl transferase WcaK-like protein